MIIIIIIILKKRKSRQWEPRKRSVHVFYGPTRRRMGLWGLTIEEHLEGRESHEIYMCAR